MLLVLSMIYMQDVEKTACDFYAMALNETPRAFIIVEQGNLDNPDDKERFFNFLTILSGADRVATADIIDLRIDAYELVEGFENIVILQDTQSAIFCVFQSAEPFRREE